MVTLLGGLFAALGVVMGALIGVVPGLVAGFPLFTGADSGALS